MDWQPIDTAPKNGAVVMFYIPTSKLPILCRADDIDAKPYWLEGATHWMPLPSPPSDKP